MNLANHFKATLLTGVLSAVPVGVVVYGIYWAESQTAFISKAIFGFYVPVFGVVLIAVVIYLIGLIVTHALGRWLLHRIDQLLLRMPILQPLYSAWKQISLTQDGGMGMWSQPVLMKGEGNTYTLGFSTGVAPPQLPGYLPVYVPSSPLPTTGRIYIVPISDCVLLKLPNEEAFKIILSSANYLPKEITLSGSTPTPPSAVSS